ncbi:hypothetical protein B0T21DRAFT_177864 [Apiosordaria backusii]|uniref:Uncharacterized protein n=1 Tax=Apiosordaria backusii TaxID=314023 RepID=A0AA40EG40_9PEZI|nr:hypothetical protein B0T21DRAFT_177864 [Apiosordaria backusii]
MLRNGEASLRDQDQYGTPLLFAALRQILDYSHGIVNSETIIDVIRHFTPLLQVAYCYFDPYLYPYRNGTEYFSILLARGSNVRARDVNGNTCLHLCFRGIEIRANTRICLDQNRKALVYLIQHDADVFAVNYRGQSVSQVAYEKRLRNRPLWSKNNGYRCGWALIHEPGDGMRGDLWDLVLADCGFNIADFRTEAWPWRPSFTTSYTKEMFKALWEGQEHLCPYYDEAMACDVVKHPFYDCEVLIEWDSSDDDSDWSEDGGDSEDIYDSEDGGCQLGEVE